MIYKACGEIDHFIFYVPDNIWKVVVSTVLQNLFVCLNYFYRYAKEANVDYSGSIREL